MQEPSVLTADKCEELDFPWGHLTWYASNKLGNSSHMTLGICRIKPGMCNPRHSHPNCIEVLRVAHGKIVHTVADGEVEMNEGDVITVPVNFIHNARNIGDTEAVLLVAFTSADRQTKGE